MLFTGRTDAFFSSQSKSLAAPIFLMLQSKFAPSDGDPSGSALLIVYQRMVQDITEECIGN